MDKEEIRLMLKDMVSSFIKDEPDDAQKIFHDALSTKMRDRVNPEPAESEEDKQSRLESEAEIEKLESEETE